MSQPAISKHLRVLERAGLIEQGRQAQWRPRRLRAGPLKDIADWVGQYRRHWEESFERLDTYLREIQDKEQEMETTMTATRIDRGSTETTKIYSEGGDLVFERTFDAPRELVWKAFTDPELVPRWWGPHGTTTTVDEMDVRPGGTWRYVSTAPDRDDVVFYGEYLEVTPPAGYKWTFMFDVEASGRREDPRPSSSRRSTAGRGSRRSATWDPPRSSKAPLRPAWSAARSRHGIGSRPCSPRADATRAGHALGACPAPLTHQVSVTITTPLMSLWIERAVVAVLAGPCEGEAHALTRVPRSWSRRRRRAAARCA